MLNTAAPPPAAQLITFDDNHRVESVVGCIVGALEAVIRAVDAGVSINRTALEPWSAHSLAARLANVCDQVAA
jgi:hypothetical protein